MDFSSMPKDISVDQLRAFAASSAGQQLMRLMQEQNTQALQSAAKHVAEGNPEKAKAALSSLLNDPAVQGLLTQFGGNHGGV